jgi:lysophospholipase L1-like esterase
MTQENTLGEIPTTEIPATDETTSVTTEETTTEEEVFLLDPQTDYETYIQYRTPLANTYRKLTEDKELRVVYFGGSVTNGAGASDNERFSWRALTGSWLKTKFPEASITNINRALGESGTYLGVHRLQNDVIGERPDLLFVEYSINDRYYRSGYDKAKSQFETLVREVRAALPETDIVVVLVTDVDCLFLNSKGKLHDEARAHEDIAKVYGISTIHVGRALAEVVNYDANEFSKYANDIVHLNDKGYEVYYRVIREFLFNSLFTVDYSKATEVYPTPTVVSQQLFDGNRHFLTIDDSLIDASEQMGGTGVTWSDACFNSSISTIPGFLIFDSSSDVLVLRFEGTEIAAFLSSVKQQNVYVTVDGGEERKISGIGHNPMIIAEGLSSGEHEIRIRLDVASGKVHFGPIFVRDETLATTRGTPMT